MTAGQRPQQVATTLTRVEAWQLDDLAQTRDVRRAHMVRGMVRYVMATSTESFLEWFDEQEADGKPVSAVDVEEDDG